MSSGVDMSSDDVDKVAKFLLEEGVTKLKDLSFVAPSEGLKSGCEVASRLLPLLIASQSQHKEGLVALLALRMQSASSSGEGPFRSDPLGVPSYGGQHADHPENAPKQLS